MRRYGVLEPGAIYCARSGDTLVVGVVAWVTEKEVYFRPAVVMSAAGPTDFGQGTELGLARQTPGEGEGIVVGTGAGVIWRKLRPGPREG